MKVITLALAALLAIGPPAARAAPRDVSSEIAARRSAINSAELILMPSLLELRGYDPSEQHMVMRGCHYVARDRADLDSLIDVVVDAKLASAAPPAEGYISLMRIQLHEGEHRAHTIVLSEDADNVYANGDYRLAEHGTVSTIPIQAGTKTERDLRFWASQHRPLATGRCATRPSSPVEHHHG